MNTTFGRFVPHLWLAAMIAIWGGSYAVVKASLGALPPFTVIAVRFWVAALCLLPFALVGPRRDWRTALGPGLIAGCALAIGYNLQTLGMQYTSASLAGFLAGLIVPLVAIGGCLFFRARFGLWSATGLLLAVFGMALLCWPEPGAPNRVLGVVLQLIATVSYVAHILLLSHFGSSMPTAPFCTWQMVVVALVGSACLPFEPSLVENAAANWTLPAVLLLGYLAVLASALGVGVQARVQHRIPPMHLALLFALQPLFAAFFGWLTLGERLGTMQLVGGASIVAGVVVTSLERAAASP
ncbi:MAG: DMT family transporter [Planctomycetes bacterium]|nr:DMT family transporter [Planctomycetota bacterium]MCB9885687.1 DMT family transporter [Planctomycetota bacterium]